MISILEFDGIIDKIEQSNITNIDIVFMKIEKNQTRMKLELVNKINPFKENDPVKIIFNTEPLSKDNPKLVMNGYLYSITKNEAINKIIITVGGLQLLIETPENYPEFKTKRDIIINFF